MENKEIQLTSEIDIDQEEIEIIGINSICRFCASQNERLIGVFSEEGVSNDLATKINLYLPVKVSISDELPLQCCWNCASTILAWHELVLTCVESDRKFRTSHFITEKQIIGDVRYDAPGNPPSDDNDGLQTNIAMGIDGGTWPTETTKWPRDAPQSSILYQNTIEIPAKMTLQEIIKKSNEFPVKFPTNETRCFHLENGTNRKILEDNVNSAYPLIHEQALYLFVSFLVQKRRFGSTLERDFYQNMTLLELIERLLTKRAVSFVGSDDEYLLLDGTVGKGSWETVGTDDEGPPLTLRNSLSYDEIKLSALLSVSSPSYFIGGSLGVVVGSIGPRLEKEKVMEYREIMKTKEQNTHLYGYGQFFVPTMQGVFTNFWGDISATYEELQMRKSFDDTSRYIKIGEDKYFDKWVYTRRIALSIDMLLVEANDRAGQQKQKASLYVAGIGLGQWRITPEQNKLFVDTFIERIRFLGPSLGNIVKVRFSHTGDYKVHEKINIEGHPHGGITVETRDWVIKNKPKTNEADSGNDNLAVFSYNWNGNALPGNEYWLHNLTTSDGAVMATISQTAELQNPHINRNIRAGNLRVVTLEGLLSFKDYLEGHKND